MLFRVRVGPSGSNAAACDAMRAGGLHLQRPVGSGVVGCPVTGGGWDLVGSLLNRVH
jgi:hypothetical protein